MCAAPYVSETRDFDTLRVPTCLWPTGRAMPRPSPPGLSAPSAGSSASEAGAGDPDAMRLTASIDASLDPDFDLSSTFDVPAFLRRQDG